MLLQVHQAIKGLKVQTVLQEAKDILDLMDLQANSSK